MSLLSSKKEKQIIFAFSKGYSPYNFNFLQKQGVSDQEGLSGIINLPSSPLYPLRMPHCI